MTIVFSHEIKGHFLEYVHHIYEICRNRNDKYIFYIPESFNAISDKFQWPAAENISFEFISQTSYDEYMSVGMIKRSYLLCKLLKRIIKQYNANKVFVSTLMTLLPYAPFIIPRRVKLSGIIYMVYLHSWQELSFVSKCTNVFKYVLMTLSNRFEYIFILNCPTSAARLNQLYHTRKFKYLPDPYIPINENIEYSIRGTYNIKPTDTLFIHIGAMNCNKGTISILESLQLHELNEPRSWVFFFAGIVENDIKEQFYKLINRIGDKVRIIIKDEFCDYSFFSNLCQECDAIVIPYKRTSQSSGIIGYSSQFKKPVIAPSKGLLGQLVRDYNLGITIEVTPQNLLLAFRRIANRETPIVDDKYCLDHSISLFQQSLSIAL